MNINENARRRALLDIFPLRYRVYAFEDKFEIVDLNDDRPKLISIDELKHVDPRFPSVLQYFIKEHGNVHFDQIDEVMDLWELDIHLKTKSDRMIAFSEIRSVQQVDDGLVVKGFGILYHNVYMPEIDTYVPIPLARPVGVTVERSWLDEAHPDWEKRLEIAQGLDLPPIDVMRNLLLQPEVFPSTTLPAELDLNL